VTEGTFRHVRAQAEVAAEHRHVAAIVPDRQKFAMWRKSDAKAPFPVLTEIDNGYAMTLGLAIYVGDEFSLPSSSALIELSTPVSSIRTTA
jgi:hypothetical protein